MDGNTHLYDLPQAKYVKATVTSAQKRIANNCESYGFVYKDEITEVEANSVSGWIPFTDGAYTGFVFVQSSGLVDAGMVQSWPVPVRERVKVFFESGLLDAYNDHKDTGHVASIAEYNDAIEKLPERIQDEISEAANEGDNEYPIGLRVVASYREDEGEVKFRLWVNFDAPYYRESYDNEKPGHRAQMLVWEAEVPIAEVTQLTMQQVLNNLENYI